MRSHMRQNSHYIPTIWTGTGAAMQPCTCGAPAANSRLVSSALNVRILSSLVSIAMTRRRQIVRRGRSLLSTFAFGSRQGRSGFPLSSQRKARPPSSLLPLLTYLSL